MILTIDPVSDSRKIRDSPVCVIRLKSSPGLPGRELYLNDPAVVPENELMTEILVPVTGVTE
jgi:hypothetical protein